MATRKLFFLALMAGLALMASSAARAADDDDTPSFGKRGDDEKVFVRKVGEAIVKAARAKPAKLELKKYEKKKLKGKDGRTNLHITMGWAGSITGKKFTSDIVVQLDSSDKDKWEVLNIKYKDDNNVSLAKPNENKIQALIKKFNRDKKKKKDDE